MNQELRDYLSNNFRRMVKDNVPTFHTAAKRVRDFLSFRRMVTPTIIRMLFWILVGVVVTLWINGYIGSSFLEFIQMALAVVGIRIYCEMTLLFFMMNETLTDIKNGLQPQPSGPGGEPGAAPRSNPATPEEGIAPGGAAE